MNLKKILKITGFCASFLNAATLITIFVAIFFNENPSPFLYALILGIFLNLILAFVGRNTRITNLSNLESAATLTFSWVFCSLLASLPFVFLNFFQPELGFSFTNAIFEGFSGLTTNGATVINKLETIPQTVIFWRALLQWIGGMGVIILVVAFLPSMGIGGLQAFRLEKNEELNSEKIRPRMRETAKIIYFVYCSLSLLLFGLLFLSGFKAFDALVHAFAAISTGGFSIYSDSLARVSFSAQFWILIFMIISALNYNLIYLVIFKRNFSALQKNSEIKTFFALLITAFIAIVLIEKSAGHNFNLFDYFFQSAASLTNTGFAIVDYSKFTAASILILVFLQIVGGTAGSTSGGIRIVRFLTLIKAINLYLKKSLRPNLIQGIKVNQKPISEHIIYSVLIYVVIFAGVVFGGTLLISIFENSLTESFFLSISAITGFGPAINQFGPMASFADLHYLTKWIIVFLMLLGRLEIMVFLICLNPSNIKKITFNS
jgi:trk system potassium uptake protein TrkH